uniref:Uncharacterized protein n=1 Tax=Nothobranchius furzeri TaxID=105023 RepID=A0A8C6LRI6_NOTFU
VTSCLCSCSGDSARGVFLSTAQQEAPRPGESYLLWVWTNRLYVYSAAALVFGTWFLLKVTQQEKHTDSAGPSCTSNRDPEVHVSGVKVFFGSQTGTAKVHE